MSIKENVTQLIANRPLTTEKQCHKEFESLRYGPLTGDYSERCQKLADALNPHSLREYLFRKYILGEYLTKKDLVKKNDR